MPLHLKLCIFAVVNLYFHTLLTQKSSCINWVHFTSNLFQYSLKVNLVPPSVVSFYLHFIITAVSYFISFLSFGVHRWSKSSKINPPPPDSILDQRVKFIYYHAYNCNTVLNHQLLLQVSLNKGFFFIYFLLLVV